MFYALAGDLFEGLALSKMSLANVIFRFWVTQVPTTSL